MDWIFRGGRRPARGLGIPAADILECAMSDRRRSGRNSTRHIAKVIDATTDRVLGRLANITEDGMMVVTDKPVIVYEIYHIRLTLPKPVNGTSSLDLQAQARWSKPDRNPRFRNAGFRFVQITEDDEELIRNVFNRFCLVG
jgi:hypothetical protein